MLFGEPYSDSSDDETREETIGDCRVAVDDSDVEIDESADPLRHAGAYTAEEITVITRDKLIQLQSLYAEYLKVLKRRYGRKRLDFRKRIKTEKESIGPLWLSAPTPALKLKLEQLGAWRRYHRRFGQEALLYEKSQKRRRLASGTPNDTDTKESVQLCNALVNGMDCGEVVLPGSSMCAKHILCDSRQILFFKCETEDCRNVCTPISDVKHCWFHQRVPDGVQCDLDVPPAAFAQYKPASSTCHQRSSVFASSRNLPSLSSNNTTTDSNSTTEPHTPQQKVSVNARNTRKRPGATSKRQRGANVKKVSAPARVGLALQPPLAAGELRNAPPIPTNKTPSFDDVTAEAGVYGAYMTTAESATDAARENSPMTGGAATAYNRASK